MIKKLLVVSLAALGVGLTGCLTDPLSPDKDTVDVTLTPFTAVAIPAATATYNYPITYTVKANVLLTDVHATVTPIGKAQVVATSVTGSFTGKKEVSNTDYGIVINFTPAVYNQKYVLTLSATAGSATLSKVDTFNFTGGKDTLSTPVGTPVTEKLLELGAQDTSVLSLLDADAMLSYSNTITAVATQAQIDVIFNYSTLLSPAALAFTSPSVAGGAPYTSWTSKAASEFKIVTTTWSSITTQEQIDALWGTGAGQTRLAISDDAIIIVKTSDNKYKLILIDSVSGTAGKAVISIKGK